jgi:hypothetical protein
LLKKIGATSLLKVTSPFRASPGPLARTAIHNAATAEMASEPDRAFFIFLSFASNRMRRKNPELGL